MGIGQAERQTVENRLSVDRIMAMSLWSHFLAHSVQYKVPQYTTDCCIQISDIARRQHLRSAGCLQLFVMQHRRSTFGRRAFFCGQPGGLELVTRLPARFVTFLLQFRRDLKTFLFSFYYRTERIRGFKFMRYITLLLTLTLTIPSML